MIAVTMNRGTLSYRDFEQLRLIARNVEAQRPTLTADCSHECESANGSNLSPCPANLSLQYYDMMFLLRIVIGLVKGVVIGGLLGGGLWYLETGGDLAQSDAPLSWARWPLYGVIGLLTGVIAGRPPWAKDAWVASILKAIVGFGFGVGLYFLVDWLWSTPLFGRAPTVWYFGFGAAVAALYGIWVELDDGGKSDDDGGTKALKGKEERPALPKGDDE